MKKNKAEKALSIAADKDSFEESVYSACHYKYDVVLELVKETIGQRRTN